jgi:nucleoside-diphosphate-sugar epimerase
VLAGIKPGITGEIFNVVDDELLTSRQLFRAYKRKVKPAFSISIPYFVIAALCRFWEKYSRWSESQVPPIFNPRRCAAEWKGNRYSNQKLKRMLGWEPRVKMADAVQSYLRQFD